MDIFLTGGENYTKLLPRYNPPHLQDLLKIKLIYYEYEPLPHLRVADMLYQGK